MRLVVSSNDEVSRRATTSRFRRNEPHDPPTFSWLFQEFRWVRRLHRKTRMSSQAFAAEDEGALRLDNRVSPLLAWPRYANLLLSAWLFVSAFIFPQTRDACGAAWIMGACMGMNAFAGLFASPARFFNVALGGISLAWQASSAAEQPAALINGVTVSGLVIAFSLVPSRIRAGS
jgi:hypothetical protein